jgi:hypothetical protein
MHEEPLADQGRRGDAVAHLDVPLLFQLGGPHGRGLETDHLGIAVLAPPLRPVGADERASYQNENPGERPGT